MTASNSIEKNGNLLYVLQSFPPCGGTGTLRMTKQIKYMDRKGWDCQVLTFQGLGSNYKDLSLLEDVERHASITRLTNYRNFATRSWALFQTVKDLTEDVDFNWLITSSPPEINHIYGCLISYFFGMRWHCDVRDPLGIDGWRRIKRLFFREVDFYTTAWPVETLIPESLLNQADSKWIINGFDPDDFQDSANTDDGAGSSRVTELLFLGSSHQPVHDPIHLVKALGELVQENKINSRDVRLKFMGNFMPRSLAEKTVDLAQEFGISESLDISGFTDHLTAMEVLTRTDIALINTSTKAIPYKFAEYVGAGKPVIAYVPRDSYLRRFPLKDNPVSFVEHGCIEELKSTLFERLQAGETGDYEDELTKRFSMETVTNELDRYYRS